MGAPKYNTYALGNNGGRPRIYKNPKDLEKKIVEYFDYCIEKKQNITVSGLTLYVGFNSRDTLHSYKNRKEYSDIIKRATLAVAEAYEQELYSFKFGGAIFALKNIDKENWKDKTEQDVKQTITNVTASFGTAIQPAQKPAKNTSRNKQ